MRSAWQLRRILGSIPDTPLSQRIDRHEVTSTKRKKMAGDYIIMRVDLEDDPDVILIASLSGLDIDSTIGKLQRLWSWADKHTRDGFLRGVTAQWIDEKVRCDGFCEAMKTAEWIVISDAGVTFPKFDKHNGKNAKSRADGRKRQQKSREKKVTNPSQKCHKVVTTLSQKTVTTEEKRREENITPSPPTPLPGESGGGGGRDFDSGKSSDPVAAFAEWRNVEAELRNLGVGDAKGAVENCQMQGMKPDDCRAVVAYWKSKPDDYWPNPIVALHQKLTRHTEGEAVDSAWLQPADKYVRREENAKATQERQQARQRELIPKSETNPVRRPPVDPERFESEYGPILSAMTRDERESFFREVAANEFEVGVFQKGWKPGGGSRKKLLRHLAAREPANTS